MVRISPSDSSRAGTTREKAKLSEQPRSAGLVYRQLCARVQLHIRQSLVQQAAEPDRQLSAHQRRTPEEMQHSARRLLKLAVVEQCVERYIYANAVLVTIFHRTPHSLVVEIVRVHARVMHASAKVYCVRAALHRDTLSPPSRTEQGAPAAEARPSSGGSASSAAIYAADWCDGAMGIRDRSQIHCVRRGHSLPRPNRTYRRDATRRMCFPCAHFFSRTLFSRTLFFARVLFRAHLFRVQRRSLHPLCEHRCGSVCEPSERGFSVGAFSRRSGGLCSGFCRSPVADFSAGFSADFFCGCADSRLVKRSGLLSEVGVSSAACSCAGIPSIARSEAFSASSFSIVSCMC